MYVSVGNHDSGAGNRYEVKEAINHGCYNPITVNYDIALLYVEEDLTANGMAAAIPWNTNPVGSDGALWSLPMVVSGWGNMNNDPNAADSYPTILQTTTVETISNEECNGYGQYQGGITPVMFCADGTTASGMRTDSCQGDSGGPLVTAGTADGQPMSPMLFGVVSFGIGCATTHAGVYADVAMFDLWIQEHLNGFYKEEGHVLATEECEYKIADSEQPYEQHMDEMVGCVPGDEDYMVCLEDPGIVAVIVEMLDMGATPWASCVPKEGCFETVWTKVSGVDCQCHDSCSACGFNDYPDWAGDCISCHGASVVEAEHEDGTGTCSANRRKLFGMEAGDSYTVEHTCVVQWSGCFDNDKQVSYDSDGGLPDCATALAAMGGQCADDSALVAMGAPAGWIASICQKSCGTCE